MTKPVVLALTGPTATGKTAVSFELARHLPIEIVLMDAFQVYRGLDIGTAKPSKDEQAQVPHHLVDVVAADAPFSVTEYRRLAEEAIRGIVSRGRIPLLVGGTGFYLRALRSPLTMGHTPADEATRQRWEAFLAAQGKDALHKRLAAVDPVSAERLHPNDSRRVIRALEVFDLTGKPLSSQRPPAIDSGPFDIRPLSLLMERSLINARCDLRVDQMMAQGLLDEVKGLLAAGLSRDAQSLQGLGYKEFFDYLDGAESLDKAVDTLKLRTRQYAKRQMTWLRGEPGLAWSAPEAAAQNLQMMLEKRTDFD